MKGKVAGETLEALFQASRENHIENDRYLNESATRLEPPSLEIGKESKSTLEQSYVVMTDASGQRCFEFV